MVNSTGLLLATDKQSWYLHDPIWTPKSPCDVESILTGKLRKIEVFVIYSRT